MFDYSSVSANRIKGSVPFISRAEMGVYAPLVGIVGSMQAAEALKLLLEVGTSLCGKLLLIDTLHSGLRTIKLSRDANCIV